ncbi:MAG: S8 family peptidase [Blastocatellia bacterium]
MCQSIPKSISVTAESIPKDKPLRIQPYQQFAVSPQAGRLNLNTAVPNLDNRWRQLGGRGVKIAVLDTGIDLGHPALLANIRDYANFANGTVNSDVSDQEGHGTMVAGVIAAQSFKRSIVGIAPEAGLYIGKVTHQNSGGNSDSLRAGIEWARQKGVHIINISLGADAPLEAVHQEIKAARNDGIFVICAAGNDGTSEGLDFPARYDECISVGAVTRNRNRWEISTGVGSSVGHELDIVAVGHLVRSTFPRNLDSSGESVRSGTSLAAPFVTGVLALALAKHRILGGQTEIINLRNVLGHLLRTAIDLGPVGPDPEFGFGLIDPERFLAEA